MIPKTIRDISDPNLLPVDIDGWIFWSNLAEDYDLNAFLDQVKSIFNVDMEDVLIEPCDKLLNNGTRLKYSTYLRDTPENREKVQAMIDRILAYQIEIRNQILKSNIERVLRSLGVFGEEK